jgi:hypothetical protein
MEYFVFEGRQTEGPDTKKISLLMMVEMEVPLSHYVAGWLCEEYESRFSRQDIVSFFWHIRNFTPYKIIESLITHNFILLCSRVFCFHYKVKN